MTAHVLRHCINPLQWNDGDLSTLKRAVTMIPARATRVPLSTQEVERRLHVAAYTCVSTDGEEQLNSHNAQVEYYAEKIQANDEWISWAFTRMQTFLMD